MDTNIETTARDRADMERLAAGQSGALDDLMERHAAKVFNFLYRMLGSEDDANDLAQETFMRVYQHRHTFDSSQSVTAWLFTIAANLARNHYRWRSRHPNVSLDAPPESCGQSPAQSVKDTLQASGLAPDQEAVAQERASAVRNAVDNLPEDMRDVIILCEWEDFSMAEAATILKTTAKAVESRLYRARKLLRANLDALQL